MGSYVYREGVRLAMRLYGVYMRLYGGVWRTRGAMAVIWRCMALCYADMACGVAFGNGVVLWRVLWRCVCGVEP